VTPARGHVPAAPLLLVVLDVVTRAMAYGSGLLFLLVAFYLTAEAVARTFLHASTAVSDEFGGYALAVGGMWALAYTLRVGAHVRIDILLPHLPARVQILLDWMAMAGMALFAAMLAIYTWRLALESLATDARATSFLRTPLFPPQALMALGLTLLCLEALTILGVGLVASVQTRRLAGPEGLSAPAEPS